jgi:hypothetical protein
MAEAALERLILEHGELGRGDVAIHRPVAAVGGQVLADRQHIHIRAAQRV